jgi:CheY-like chemotaxis protein
VARGRLQALRQHTDLMLRLVNDLLDLSAIQMGAFRLREQPVQLRELIRQTAESLRPRAEAKGVEFFVHLEPGVPEWACVDGERVRQIVLNLVSNAVKFTDQGRVEVTLGGGPTPPAVRLTVRDTGPGIPDGQRASLFQPFSRLEATIAKEGTGLGLSLAAALCRSMQGQILLDEQAEGGASFSATFAAPACAAPGPARRAEPDLAAALRGLRVLIADDNSLVRDLFASYLREAGADCTAVGDGEQALAALGRENYDCLVLDLAMPRLDGWETARRLHRHRPAGLRLVGVSAHADESDRGRAAALGFDAFLVKPVELNTLACALGADRSPNPGADSSAELLARLRLQFRHEAAAQRAAVQVALQEKNTAAVQAAAHYLCNSAAVVRDDCLHGVSARLEIAAQAGEPAALAAAWRDCEQALAPWLDANPIPPGSTPAFH